MNKEEAIEKLSEWIKEGDTLWTQVHHVTKSGMTRYIGVRTHQRRLPLQLHIPCSEGVGQEVERQA